MMHYDKRTARRYWYLAGGVLLAIILGWLLPIDRQQRLWSHDVQVFLFATGLALIAVAVVCYTFQHQPKPISWGVFFGLLGVLILLVFRLDAPERSHLIEYAALAICIHKALQERFSYRLWDPAVRAVVLAGGIGFLDEAIQAPLPNRSFAWEDIWFNLSTVTLTVGSHVLLRALETGKWPRFIKRFKK